jgi:hypothetical protein
VTNIVLGTLGLGDARIQRLYQASTDGWSGSTCQQKLQGATGGKLLFISKLAGSRRVVGAYTGLDASGLSHEAWKQVPRSLLFSFDATTGAAPDLYMERPLSTGKPYYVMSSQSELLSRGNGSSVYYSVNLPRTSEYRVEFPVFRADSNHSFLRFCDSNWGQLGNYVNTSSFATTQAFTTPTLNVYQQIYGVDNGMLDYKFIAWSTTDTRASVCLGNTSLEFGARSDLSRLSLSFGNKTLTEPPQLGFVATAHGYESAPQSGCLRYLSGSQNARLEELEVWLIEEPPTGDAELPEATHPVVLELGGMSTSVRRSKAVLSDDEAQRLWGDIDIGMRQESDVHTFPKSCCTSPDVFVLRPLSLVNFLLRLLLQ